LYVLCLFNFHRTYLARVHRGKGLPPKRQRAIHTAGYRGTDLQTGTIFKSRALSCGLPTTLLLKFIQLPISFEPADGSIPLTPRTGNPSSSTTICQKVAHPNSVCNSELIMTSSQWTLLPLPPPSSTPPPPPILAGCSKLQLRSSERNHYNYEQDDRHAYTVELPSKGLPFADRMENLNHRAANRGSNRSSATFCILLAVGTGWRGWLKVFAELRMSMRCKIHTTLPQDVAQ
jgi:hypothetical protein